MRKILITILGLLLMPALAMAADELTFSEETNLEVNGITLKVRAGSIVDQMVVNAANVVFTLSANSGITIRSEDRKILNNNISDILCGDSYSQISVAGNSSASTLTVSPSSETCVSTTGGGGSPSTASSGGGGGAAVTTTATTETTTTTAMPETTSGEVTATASGGGKTTLSTDEDTTAAVEMPANAVSASTDVNIATESKDTVTESRPAPTKRTVVGSYVYNYTAEASGQEVDTFDEDLTLTFTYTDDQISGLDESTLRVFYWKESTSQWVALPRVALPTTVDADSNSLTAETDHFTYFAIMGLTEGEEEEDDEIVEEEETTTTSSQETVLADGDLVRNSQAEGMAQFDIYIVKKINGKKFKRLIVSPHVFESYEHFDKDGDGAPWDDVIEVNQYTLDAYTTSDLARADGYTKVYKLSDATGSDTGTKQWLNMTSEQFTAQYDADSIYTINTTDRDAYTTGTDITS